MVFFATRGLLTKSYNPVFAENEWAAIIEACHANEVPDEWVADGTCYKDMLIGGTNYRIDIIGKNHDDLADGTGKAPLTFQMHDCYETTYPINDPATNVGGWSDCQMRTQTLPSLKLLLPDEVQIGIRPVKKLTSAGNRSSSIVNTSDELFLLSEVEIFGTSNSSFSGEGIQYEYYTIGNSKLKSITSYWNRGPGMYNSAQWSYTYLSPFSGEVEPTSGNSAMKNGVSFAFCF